MTLYVDDRGVIPNNLVPNDNSSWAVGNNLAAIQGAIDHAAANHIKTIRLPAGQFSCNSGIYLDPPGNLRANINNPTNFAFSLQLQGAGSSSNNSNGTILSFLDNTQPLVIVGPGQSMLVTDLDIVSQASFTSRSALPANGMGIAISGGNGGASGTLIERCGIFNLRSGITVGWNNSNLGDATTVRLCRVSNCYNGFKLFSNNNFIVNLDNNIFGDCTVHVDGSIGNQINVIGGNYSTTNTYRNILTIGGVSPLATFTDTEPGGSFTNYQFTAALSNPDQMMIDGAYDSFVIKTSGYGLVPLKLVNYNPSTQIATLAFYLPWLVSQYLAYAFDMIANSDIQTELQAATSLFAAERVRTFKGAINAVGVHIENPGVLTTVMDTLNAKVDARMSHCYCNYAIDQNSYNINGNSGQAVFYTQQVFPFISVMSAAATFERSIFGGINLTDNINIELAPFATRQTRFIDTDIFAPNLIVPEGGLLPTSFGQWASNLVGNGLWEPTPFLPRTNSFAGMGAYGVNGNSFAPFQGWGPRSDAMPRLTPTQVAAIQSGPPAIGSYPPLHGQTFYSVVDVGTPSNGVSFVRSAHRYFSYGQPIVVNWSYVGASNVLNVSDTTKFFPGLYLILPFYLGGERGVVCTGVYPSLGYVTTSTPIQGVKGTTYTGTSVGQEPYVINSIGF